jgi:16S rRNA (adenine1518-N6/adenine1519-N6)-dimethyltransferase
VNETNLLGARAVREMLDRRGLHPKKRYGQNFVVDPNTIRKVLDVAALNDKDHVLEIGAGLGSLTVGLARVAGRVTAVEVDERLLPLLTESIGDASNVEVVHADVMKMNLDLDVDAVVANLPYNLAASIVLKVLYDAPSVGRLTVMAQREVGERLVAPPGSKIYGQTSVLLAFHARATVAARISRNAFYPVPDVDSVLVRIDRERPPEVDEMTFVRVVRAAFSQRRKTLRNALAELGPGTQDAFAKADVAPTARAEELGLDAYVGLARAVKP